MQFMKKKKNHLETINLQNERASNDSGNKKILNSGNKILQVSI